MWSEWEPNEGRAKYLGAIDKLLSAALANSDSPGPRAYMHECHRKATDTGAVWNEPEAVYELPQPKDACGWPNEWLKASDWRTMGKVFPAPGAHAAAGRQAGNIAIHGVPEWGDMFCTRIFMDADCYRTALEWNDNFDYWILIDMRFQQIPDSSVLWHTSVSWWSHPPRSCHHCPPGIDPPHSNSLSSADVNGLLVTWNESRRKLRALVDAPERNRLTVFGRSYLPPSFLIAVPERRNDDTATTDLTALGHQSAVFRQVANEMLWTQNYDGVSQSLLKGGIWAFRRLIFSADDIDAPRYLLVPDTQARVRNPKDVDSWRKLQEEAAAAGTRILTDLEAYAASKLNGIDSEMRITKNHLEIYRGVAVQAVTLWDALARLLPDARRRRLDVVHRSIEMLHQALLQGVADLDHLARKIDGVLAHIEFTAEDVGDRFNRQLEHPRADSKGQELCDSLRGAYFDRLRREVGQAASIAARVTESYNMLLETIGMAFDERRVRENDRLQQPALFLALALGVLGLSGVVQATWPLNPNGGTATIVVVRVIVLVIAVCAAAWASWQLLKLRSLGRVVRPAFESRFTKVREFLAVVSTDRLDDFSRTHPCHRSGRPTRQPEIEKKWEDLDRELCTKFVGAWEAAWTVGVKAPDLSPLQSYEAEPLRSRVESWTLQALMLTERPRDFSRYLLPRLTCLYRLCTTKIVKDWRNTWQPDERMSNVESAVGEAELKKALETALPPDRARHLLRNLLSNERLLITREAARLRRDLWDDDIWNALCTGQEVNLGDRDAHLADGIS
jgi:hypothetical protein